ncbi:MAG TPA: RnfABCDGE type electron transport complex subunit D [Candidatus Limnocylindrales bacterium]|nr:RnfABCDGE type electron transport complex subunit D [Candidatus Limnocylindrales bacterium]
MHHKLIVSSSPHLRSDVSVQSTMIDVLIALFPAALMAVLLFGYQALLTMVISVVSAMLAEALWLRKRDLFSDGSAAVTGLLFALTLPPSPPWWLVVVGAACAIIIGKQVFGGIGYNIFNPALVGRAIVVVSWGTHMAGRIWPVPSPFAFGADISAVTTATPLEGQEHALAVTLQQMFIGDIAGSLGETSALALLIGGLWLFYKGHIDWRIPGGFIGTVFIMGTVFGEGFYGNSLLTGLFHVLAGGALLGAIFMATDMVTSPITAKGKLIFGIGCGLITMLIRVWGALPEGVTFAILIMNAVTPIIDNFTIPNQFGGVKKIA